MEKWFLISLLLKYCFNYFLVAKTSEEYKLEVIQCMTNLTNALTWDVIQNLYVKEHATRISQLVYTCVKIAKTEKMHDLR